MAARDYEGIQDKLYKKGALIGGEKYEEEYGVPYDRPLIGGEKYEEEYRFLTPEREEPALIGGEKYLEEYASTQESSVDKFGQSVDTFDNGVSTLISQLQEEAITSQPAQTETETQGFWQRLLQFFTDLSLFGTAGIGQGAGIGPIGDLGTATSRLESAANSLESMALPQYQQLGPPSPMGGFSDIGSDFGSILDLLTQKISNLSGFTTNLKISSTSTTNLIVDGRVLAEVVKPYLYSDMIRYEDSATSITKNIVV
jgi:hypothetical protein